jgi:hypothetical protein
MSSGTLRNTTNTHLTVWRSMAGAVAMDPDSADSDSVRTDNSAKGIASSMANAKPTVAIATVRHVSWATKIRNSASNFGG